MIIRVYIIIFHYYMCNMSINGLLFNRDSEVSGLLTTTLKTLLNVIQPEASNQIISYTHTHTNTYESVFIL